MGRYLLFQNALIALIGFQLFVTSCGPSAKEIALDRLQKAETFVGKKEFNSAKLVLDSIIEEQSNVVEVTEKAKVLLKTIKIQEQNNNIRFIDSLLQAKENELAPLMKNFVIEDEYQNKVLIHKRQKTTNSFNRTYIRSHLDLEGNFYISSYYCGTSHINHRQIKAYFKDKSVTSVEVPFDEFNNRHFDDGENKWEIVNYKDGKDNGIIDFIAANSSESIKIQFIGKSSAYIVMESFDKQAISDGYEISFLLREVSKLKSELENAKRELTRL